MNLKELQLAVNAVVENYEKYGTKANDINVVITLSEPSVGLRAYSNVSNLQIGFDWEQGQLRIEPDKKLVSEEFSLKRATETQPKPRIKKEKTENGKYICHSCGNVVNKKDAYCKHCGARFTKL